jgi:hypothetical protein
MLIVFGVALFVAQVAAAADTASDCAERMNNCTVSSGCAFDGSLSRCVPCPDISGKILDCCDGTVVAVCMLKGMMDCW